MAQPYVGEIRMFAGNFAPIGWLFCDGQLLSIADNDTLFQLIGTTYGGDGQTTFALPDLRGRVPIHQGSGFLMGESGGVEQVTLTASQIPAHSHPALASSNPGTGTSPSGNVFASLAGATNSAYGTDAPHVLLSPDSATASGGSQPHSNLQPYLCVNFIISMFGIFPTPN